MKKSIVLLFIFLLMACTHQFVGVISADQPNNGSSATRAVMDCPVGDTECEAIAAFDTFVANHQQNDQIAGAAMAIMRDDEILFIDGYGMRDVAGGLPVTEDTFFHIGSVTKSFTALLAATLIEDGTFTWDTPAVQIYPDFALSDPNATQTVTLRHLVSMRAGIPDYVEDDFDLDNSTAEDVFTFLESAELQGAPGTQFSYSNMSNSVAGYLSVIAESGNDQDLYNGYADLLTDLVLRPIGMANATVRVSELQNNPNYGNSYVVEGGQLVEADPEDIDGDPLAPSGIVKASIEEMAIYLQLQLGRGIAANGQRIFAEATITELWQPYLESYGLGWETKVINGVTLIEHEGSFDNYLSVVGFLPDQDIGYVILSNTADSSEILIEDSMGKFVELFGEPTTPLALTLTKYNVANRFSSPLWFAAVLLTLTGWVVLTSDPVNVKGQNRVNCDT